MHDVMLYMSCYNMYVFLLDNSSDGSASRFNEGIVLKVPLHKGGGISASVDGGGNNGVGKWDPLFQNSPTSLVAWREIMEIIGNG